MGVTIKKTEGKPKEKKSAVKESAGLVSRMQKEYGDKSIRKAGELPDTQRMQTGVFPLDLAIGGGIPINRNTVIYGPESSMKTTIALLTARAFQRQGQTVAYIDAEHAFDPTWARLLDVNLDEMLVAEPDTAEQAVDMMQAMFHAKDVGLVVLDSIGALATANEVESDSGKAIVGGSAALVTKMLHKINSGYVTEAKRNHFPTVVIINQNRFQIGKMFGDPEKMPGGQLLKFSSSMTLRLYGTSVVNSKVNTQVPSFKKVSGTVRKYRVPIVANTFEFHMCVLPHNGMKPGDVDAWNTVSNRLKLQGDLEQLKKGWRCLNEEFKTLDELHKRYIGDFKFGDTLRKLVFEKAFDMHNTPVIDTETGEILSE